MLNIYINNTNCQNITESPVPSSITTQMWQPQFNHQHQQFKSFLPPFHEIFKLLLTYQSKGMILYGKCQNKHKDNCLSYIVFTVSLHKNPNCINDAQNNKIYTAKCSSRKAFQKLGSRFCGLRNVRIVTTTLLNFIYIYIYIFVTFSKNRRIPNISRRTTTISYI